MRILLANFTKMIDDSGGLAKVNCAFANEMVRRGHDVATVYSDDREGAFFFPLDARVQCCNLRHYHGKSTLFPTRLKVKREILRTVDVRKGRAVNNDFVIRYLRENIQEHLEEFRPDIIIAFQPAAAMIYISVLHTDIPVICMSHGDPEDYFHMYDPRELPSLAKCAACQVLLPSFREHLLAHIPEARVDVIGNVVPQYEAPADLAAEKATYKILFLGRLVKNHKRPHLLIQAFARLAEMFPEWQVEFWGAEDRKRYTEELQALIAKYHLENRVFLKGSTRDVENILRTGDIFAFPSAYEGFGLALAEAMSMGLPVIGYRSAPAVNELIRDGENGFLCADGVEDFADHLRTLMTGQALRVRMGQAARAFVQKYAAEAIWEQWETLMQEVVSEDA